MKRLLTIFFLVAYGLLLFGQEDIKTGIIYGNDYAFSLTAPNGWVLDNKSGVDQGIQAVFYQNGESWKNAETVMYANTASLQDEAHETLAQLIKFDLNNFINNYSDIKISEGKDILIEKKSIAKVKYLSGKSYGNFEAIAYIDAGKTGVMIIMSSKTKKGFDKSLKDFEDLVKSYIFLTNNVHINLENK